MSVLVLPELATRIAGSATETEKYYYKLLFVNVSHIAPFPYSLTPRLIHGVDYQETEIASLPALTRRLDGRGKDEATERTALLAWWAKLQEANPYEGRIMTMRTLTGKLAADGTNMTGDDYRKHLRANVNYGIFNLPVYITLVRKDNNPLAFMEFLCVSSHPTYRELPLSGNAVERLKVIAAKWPTQKERVEVFEKWWADNATKYETALPALASAIATSMKD